MNWIKAMEKIKTDTPTLRKFGLIMALFFAVVTMIIFIKHGKSVTLTAIISLSFLFVAIKVPILLKYFYIIWMKLVFILSWFNTKVLLCAIFYLIFSPVGLAMRLFRVDLLERRFAPSCTSYWRRKKKKEYSSPDYERQF